MKRRAALLLALAALAGCAAPAGPKDPGDFDARLRQAVGPGVQLSAEGWWHPNSRGFTALRNAQLEQTPPESSAGIAFTDTSIVVAQWAPDSNRFEVVKRIQIAELREAWVDSLGRGRRLVVRRADMGFDSFTFTNHGTAMVDQASTDRAIALLRSRVPDRAPADQ